MSDGKTKGILLAAIIWIIIIGLLAVAAKFFILPYFQTELESDTGSSGLYTDEIVMAADSFSGYAILRSEAFRNSLKKDRIKLTIQDDKADYEARLKAMDDQDIQMAVFTIDSLVFNGGKLGKFPASIVMVIDETSGADALVSYKEGINSIQDLDDPAARIMLTPQSPSEFLARTVIAHFNLPGLPAKWWVEADGAGAVYRAFKTAEPKAKTAYALWEPYVSMALEVPGSHVLLDSSKLKGYIVDVLVAERNFLRDHPDIVKAVVESYLRTGFSYGHKANGMRDLIVQDARDSGAETLTEPQAENLVKGIEWKNTLENYVYFGLSRPADGSGILHIQDIIENITNVLVKTGTLDQDPLAGKSQTLYYDKILRELQANDFHPGKTVDVIQGLGQGTADLDSVRPVAVLRALTEAEWQGLSPVGTLRVDPINFARGTARINIQSSRDLDALAKKLNALPYYYLTVTGHTRAEGDVQANLILAQNRAQAAYEHLLQKGVNPNRIRTKAAQPSGTESDSQSVTFDLGQLPY